MDAEAGSNACETFFNGHGTDLVAHHGTPVGSLLHAMRVTPKKRPVY